MKFSVGDKVILKRSGEEGIVADWISADMLEVEVSGVRFPVFLDDVEHPYLGWFTSKSKEKKKETIPDQLPVEKQKHRPARLSKGVYLSFMPEYKLEEMEDIIGLLKIYLVNEMPVPVYFHYELTQLNQSIFKHEGKLHAFGDLYLHSIPYADMNDQPKFHWRVKDAVNEQFEEASGTIRIKPVKLAEQLHELMQKNAPTFSYQLVDDFLPPKISKPVKPEIPRPKAPKTKQPVRNFVDLPKYEVDLHIEAIVENHRGMTHGDMMDLQLSTLHRYLHLAILSRQERMIVIHGLGTGALRDAVHEVLRTYPEVKKFSNEWLGNYGFGAAEVHFGYLK